MVFKEFLTRLCTGALSSTLIFAVSPAGGEVVSRNTVKAETLYAPQTAANSATTNTVRKIKKKTQTGIDVSYKNTTKEKYSHIDPEFVNVYPVYTIEYDNGDVEKNQVDKKTRINADDLDIDYGVLFDKGENEFYAKQLSTGFEDTFTVLGAEIVKQELNGIYAMYKGEGVLKVGDKVPYYDIDVVPQYKVTYDNGEVAYENDYTVSCYDFEYSPKTLTKTGDNEIKLEYTPEDTDKSLTTTIKLNAKDAGNTASDEKKNEEDESQVNEGGNRSSIPIYVDAEKHVFTVTVLDIFLDENENETSRQVREKFEVKYGNQIEVEASDFDKYYLVSDASYFVTITEDTEIKFYYQHDKTSDKVKPEKEDKPGNDPNEQKDPKSSDDDSDGGNRSDTKPSGDNGSHNETPEGNSGSGDNQSDDSISDGDESQDDDSDRKDSDGSGKKKKDKKKKNSKSFAENEGSDDEDNSKDPSYVSYKKYSQDAVPDEDKEVVTASKQAKADADMDTGKDDKGKERTYRTMATGVVSSIVGIGLMATGAFRYLWMLLLTLFTRKKRHKWHGIISSRKNRFVEVRDASGLGKLYQDYIDEHKELDVIYDELRKTNDYTLLPVNTKADVTYADDCISVVASEEEVFSVLNKLPKGIGTVNVRIYNDMARFEMHLTFTL